MDEEELIPFSEPPYRVQTLSRARELRARIQEKLQETYDLAKELQEIMPEEFRYGVVDYDLGGITITIRVGGEEYIL